MRLTLIRHGLTLGNVHKLYYGSTDLPLTKEGEATLLRKREICNYPTAEHYFTSGMRRTEQTLELLYGAVPHKALPGLREMNFGAFEMRSYEALRENPAYQTWIQDNMEENRCPNGESAAQATARALAALEPILSFGEDAVCITHGGIIAGLMLSWFPGQRHRYGFTPAPGDGYCVEVQASTAQSFFEIPSCLE